jgi:ubiquinone/menaquinone biosynthesis C-methylase UbiE
VFSDWTIEHVADPSTLMIEIYRVLRPGGSYWFRTSNLGHYSYLIAKLTPNWFHRRVANWARQLASDVHDPWPTHYRMNTLRRVKRTLGAAGFIAIDVRLVEPLPSYLQFSPWLFTLGIGYERLVNRFSSLCAFRAIIFGKAEKCV